MSIVYTVRDGGCRHELPLSDAMECDTEIALEAAAEVAASDFYSEHDGWESTWPLTITLYDGKNGPELGRFTVEREYEPVFRAAALARKERA